MGHLSRPELRTILTSVLSVALFVFLDAQIEMAIPVVQDQLLARLVVLTVLVVVNKTQCIRFRRRVLRQLAIRIPIRDLLNPRDQYILHLLARGLTVHEIALVLVEDDRMVEASVAGIMDTVDVCSVHALTRWAAEYEEVQHDLVGMGVRE